MNPRCVNYLTRATGLRVLRLNSGRFLSGYSDNRSDPDQEQGFFKTFASEFKSSVKTQYEKDKELSDSIGVITDGKSDLSNLPLIKGIRNVAQTTSETTSKIIDSISDATERTLDSQILKSAGGAVSKATAATAEVTRKIADPILSTKTAKMINSGIKLIKEDVIDNSDVACYNADKGKDIRENEWSAIVEEKYNRMQKRISNMEALSSSESSSRAELTVVEPGVIEKYIEKLKDVRAVGKGLHSVTRGIYDTCDIISDKISKFSSRFSFEETEEAQAIRLLINLDPEFTKSKFLNHATLYIIPEIIEAFLRQDLAVLRNWADEKVFVKLKMAFESLKYADAEIVKGELIDCGDVNIHSINIVDGKIPIITTISQVYEAYKYQIKRGDKIKYDTKVESAVYLFKFTKINALNPIAKFNLKTDNWVITDFSRLQK